MELKSLKKKYQGKCWKSKSSSDLYRIKRISNGYLNQDGYYNVIIDIVNQTIKFGIYDVFLELTLDWFNKIERINANEFNKAMNKIRMDKNSFTNDHGYERFCEEISG